MHVENSLIVRGFMHITLSPKDNNHLKPLSYVTGQDPKAFDYNPIPNPFPAIKRL
jgi:hypothetical protein